MFEDRGISVAVSFSLLAPITSATNLSVLASVVHGLVLDGQVIYRPGRGLTFGMLC